MLISISKLELKKIIKEHFIKLITEDKSSDNRSKGRKIVRHIIDIKAGDDYEREVKKAIPFVKINNYKYAQGVYRLYFLEKLTSNECHRLNNLLKDIETNNSYDEYDSNLNSLSKDKLLNLTSNNKQLTDNDNEYKYNGYKVVKLNTFDEASKYQNFCSFCVCEIKRLYEHYTNFGERACYLLLKKGYQNVSIEDTLNYMFSMICIFINPDGSIYSTTSRENDTEEFITNNEVNKLLGINYKSVLKPNSQEEIIKSKETDINLIKNKLKQGAKIESIGKVIANVDKHYILKLDENKFCIIQENNLFYQKGWFVNIIKLNKFNFLLQDNNQFYLIFNIKDCEFKLTHNKLNNSKFIDYDNIVNNNVIILKDEKGSYTLYDTTINYTILSNINSYNKDDLTFVCNNKKFTLNTSTYDVKPI